MTRLLTIMGSGETAPVMAKAHRSIFERLDAEYGSVPAVFLDTPFGFQGNVDQLNAKTLEYFTESIGRSMSVAGLTRPDAQTALERETGWAKVRDARYLFAGPGSPTYALQHWIGGPLADIVNEKLQNGGAVTFSSAAALTLGVKTVPVYEIYKVGQDPHWLDGLDVMSTLNLSVAVIPHYNNAEGGNHDTRFCWLGERRLAALEDELPPGVHVLGLDEHTGVTFDLDADTATVLGIGVLTIRVHGDSYEVPAGETVPIDVLRTRAGATGNARPATTVAPTPVSSPAAAFDQALLDRDARAAVAAALALEEAGSDDYTRSLLRSMIVRLGDAAEGGLTDRRVVLAPVVEVALTARREVRAAKRYDLSDLIRDELAATGVEVRDTPNGQEWDLV